MQTLENSVLERLERDILNGSLPSGSPVTEIGISERYGVSRTPAREALILLEREGLIARGDGRGGLTVAGLSDADIDDIYRIRMRIEGLASRYMAERGSAEEKEELAEAVALQEFYAARADAMKLRELDTRFHEVVYRASGSRVLIGTLSGFHKQIYLCRERAFLSPERTAVSVGEHKEILGAILAGDGDAAERLTAAHVRNAYEFLIRKRETK